MTKRALPQRDHLPHEIPSWVEDHSIFFITICCKPKGRNQLCRTDVFQDIQGTTQIYTEKSLWFPHLLLLMPDHLHGLISFGSDVSMKSCIARFKRYIAVKCKVAWQDDFFDHRLRSDESHEEKASYILNNPVRKKLCATPAEWPWILRVS